MKFTDLDDKAKEKARDWMREQAFTDSFDWDHVYSDAVEIGALMGIEIDNRVVKIVRGVAYDEPDIQFSGFCCQGDGCSYSAQLRVEQMAGCVEKVKAHVGGEDEKLHALAMRAEEIHTRIAAYRIMIRISDEEVDGDAYPQCEPDMHIAIVDTHGFSTKMADDSLCPPEISKEVNTFVSDFAHWIYKQLEAEYDHQTSDATLEENLVANDYDFDEDGAVA